MSEPVVFISHFAIKEGALDDLRRYSADGHERIREEKPGTVLFLSYLGRAAGGSRSSMPSPTRTHWIATSRERTNEQPARTSSSSPEGWEFYGRPSEQVIETMQAAAERYSVPLVVEPEFNGQVPPAALGLGRDPGHVGALDSRERA